MTKQELIDTLEKDPIEEYVYGTDVDPLVVEGKLNLILQYLKRPGDAEGTDVYLLDQFIKRLDFKENPQDAIDRLDGLIDSLDSTKADNDQLQAVINSLADKTNVGTEKETTLSVSTLQEFQDHFYQLRKLPSRSYQYEVSSSLNLDLMDVLGWPNGNGNQAFIYVDLPYNESGGFELDITYMERFHNNIYKRTMTSTNNGNWQDTGWVQYASKADLTTLASVVETNTSKLSTIKHKFYYPTNKFYLKNVGSLIIYTSNVSVIHIGSTTLDNVKGVNMVSRFDATHIMLNGTLYDNHLASDLITIDSYGVFLQVGD